MAQGGGETRAVDVVVGAGVRADLELVDALARLQLAAARLGCAVRVHGADDDLRALIGLVGLAEVLPDDRLD